MTLRWIPQWYELDWTIVVGDTDWFILSDPDDILLKVICVV